MDEKTRVGLVSEFVHIKKLSELIEDRLYMLKTGIPIEIMGMNDNYFKWHEAKEFDKLIRDHLNKCKEILLLDGVKES